MKKRLSKLALSPDSQSLSGIVAESIRAGSHVTIRKIDGEYRLVVTDPDVRAIPQALRHVPGLKSGADRSFATFRKVFQK